MARRCQITGRGPQMGNNVSHAHNITRRRFNINLQKVRVLVNGQVQTMRVSTRAIKSGLITKPPIKIRPPRIKSIQGPQLSANTTTELDESTEKTYFSTNSVVTRLFKPKPAPTPEENIEIEEMDLQTIEQAFQSSSNDLTKKEENS